MLEKCASFTCYLHEKSQEMKFCGPRPKSLAGWTRRPSEQSDTWRLNDGNVVKRSCRGCDDTNKKCSLLMERCAFEYQPELGCRLLLQVQVKSKVASTCQILVSCKRCIFVRGGSTLKSEQCTVCLHLTMNKWVSIPHFKFLRRKLWRPIGGFQEVKSGLLQLCGLWHLIAKCLVFQKPKKLFYGR